MTSNEGAISATDDGAERLKLQRALLEVEATRLRIRENADHVYDATRRDLIVQLLPVLDNLDRAVDAAKTASDSALVDGVRIVRAELETVLFRYGVERVDATGQAFDPAQHEAVTAVPAPDSKLVGCVILQIAPGYRLGNKVLRPAKVGVGVRAASEPDGRSSAHPRDSR